ncbi:CinA family protein [Oceanobacter mangrovi]|uniref:CinA family protein n=1 Tax=Oceanobacter mangrovi TaxID=2862510 RepID=UPI001C8D7FC8|nr:CinA family protein [Oceanobacter mangrovi]
MSLLFATEELAEQLTMRRWRMATAESCTGGGIAAACTDLAGSSGWFDCGFVTYSNEAKMQMLGVQQTTLEQHGAVSEATVREMVAGAVQHSRADVAVATSGIAGPGGAVPGKPVGTVWVAWGNHQRIHAELCHFDGDRAAVRQQAVLHSLRGLSHWLEQA